MKPYGGRECSSVVVRKANDVDGPTNVSADKIGAKALRADEAAHKKGQKMREPDSVEAFYCRLRSTFLISRRKLGI
jgi:hypothetical protein